MLVVNYPSKRAMIQQILEKHGYFDWYIAQPDTQNPDSRNPRCILINFAEKKRAELVIPYEWFQRYHRIAKLIALSGSASFASYMQSCRRIHINRAEQTL
jgi:hypothetical protein